MPHNYRNFSPQYWEEKTLAPSAVLAYVGLRRKLDVPHHNIVVNGKWEEHFNSLFGQKRWPPPSSISYYVSVRSKSDPTVCPEDREALFFLIPVAPGLRDRERELKLAWWAVQDFLGEVEDVEFLKVFGPEDFERDYHAYMGTAFGLAHTLSQTASLRPPLRNRRLRNLYHVGQYTHPGVGVPMVVISAQLVSGLILKNQKN
ncbi:hypothetical protein HS1genome_2033 [Sulfodiicoccus acidiphilus]|uniref:Amine oxidase domain-containing protein n=1 Tax=Sulfodiicoccus acidiphilus TaxID=1670455 RepID=A0A348B642_9CREN|nr:hypothetical protein HS1genome_2033 [Sulfodiicoccus acidiphilus]